MTAIIGAVLAVAFGVFLVYLFIIWPLRAARGVGRTVHRVVSPEAQARFEVAKETAKAELTAQPAEQSHELTHCKTGGIPHIGECAEPDRNPPNPPLTKEQHLDSIKALKAQLRALPKPSLWTMNTELVAQQKALNLEIRKHHVAMSKIRQNGSA